LDNAPFGAPLSLSFVVRFVAIANLGRSRAARMVRLVPAV
jgi:hypothetical protein